MYVLFLEPQLYIYTIIVHIALCVYKYLFYFALKSKVQIFSISTIRYIDYGTE